MAFVSTERGCVNLDHVAVVIESYRQGEQPPVVYILKGIDGENLGTTTRDVWEHGGPVIAALPGFNVLKFWYNDGVSIYVEAQPVIGWRIGDPFPVPITVDDVSDPFAIELPDGRVVVQACSIFDDRQAWIDDETITAAATKEAKAAVKAANA